MCQGLLVWIEGFCPSCSKTWEAVCATQEDVQLEKMLAFSVAVNAVNTMEIYLAIAG